MEVYKLNIKSQLRHLLHFIVGTLFFALFYIYSNFTVSTAYVFIGFYILSGVIPRLITHISYILVNRGVIIKFDKNENHFFYNDKKIHFEEIIKIEMHQSMNKLKRHTQLLPTNSYHYSKIFLKSGDFYYVTCLIVDEFDLNLTEKIIEKPRYIATIFFKGY